MSKIVQHDNRVLATDHPFTSSLSCIHSQAKVKKETDLPMVSKSLLFQPYNTELHQTIPCLSVAMEQHLKDARLADFEQFSHTLASSDESFTKDAHDQSIASVTEAIDRITDYLLPYILMKRAASFESNKD